MRIKETNEKSKIEETKKEIEKKEETKGIWLLLEAMRTNKNIEIVSCIILMIKEKSQKYQKPLEICFSKTIFKISFDYL